MPKLLFVVTQSDLGGAQRAVLALARATSAAGFAVTVAAGADGGGALGAACRAAGVTYRTLTALRREIRPFGDLHAARALRRLVQELSPDIVHAHSSKAGAVAAAALVGLRLRPKLVYTAHGWVFLEPGRSAALYRFIERAAGRFRDATIVLSSQERDAALTAHVARPETLHVIPNGIAPVPHDRAAARAALGAAGLSEAATIVGCVANFYPAKNVPALIAAFDGAPADAHLVLIGDGPERDAVAATARGKTRIHLLGTQDARPLLDGLDLFVLPSVKEGLPFGLLEAMEAGLPCLATSVGGIPSVIADGMNGWLTTPDALAAGLTRAFAAREQWPRVGAAARDTVRRLFTEERMARETIALYRRLTGSGTAAG